MEDFYKDPKTAPSHKGFKNLDSPDSINFKMLENILLRLKKGESVTVPIFSKQKRDVIGAKILNPKPIIIVEGFLLFSKNKIRKLINLLIFIDIDSNTQLLRKFKRKEGNDLDINYYQNVLLPMSKKYVTPTKKYATYIVDGSKTIKETEKEVKSLINFHIAF